MYKRIQHIIVLLLLLLGSMHSIAQIAMPDTVCVGVTRVYKVNDVTVPSTYTWKINGVTQASTKNDISITWNSPGIFQLTVQEYANNGCEGDIRTGNVYVNPLPVANAGPDAVVCFGNTVRLNGSGGDIYQWSPATYLSNVNIANPVAAIPFAGTYKYVLNVSSAYGCKSVKSDTVSLTVLPPVKVFAGNDTLITVNQPLQLNAIDVNNSGFINYLWSPSFGLSNTTIKNPVASYNNQLGNNGQTYIVTARTVNGCEAKDDITIKVFVASEIYVPNAFTPNGDGANDILKPILVGIKELKYFAVFNRYGQMIYKTTVHGQGWNGMVKGEMQNTGGFAWMAEAIDYKGNTITRKGMAVLIK
jgi:gliding motility-associated-like protein